MRPLKLTMQAFGPYAGKTDVDLELLGGKGLYLVTGDTGAGKTTIFDGICYALFGKASGDSRAVNMFRSEYADASVITYVELLFEYGGAKYLVHREPKQKTPKKRGEGERDLNTVNELYIVGEGRPIAANESEVNDRIKEILGLDHSQYRNVAMIAQGSFAELLNTKTDSRTKILSAIFSTGKFALLQERLKDDLNLISRQYETTNDMIRSLLGSMKLGAENPYNAMIQASAEDPEAAADTDLEDICVKASAFEKARADSADDRFKQADKYHKAAVLALNNGMELRRLFDKLRLADEDLKKLAPQLAAAEENAKKLSEQRPEVNALIGQIAADTKQLGLYDEAEALLKEAAGLEASARGASKKIDELSLTLENDKKRLEALKKFIADNGDVGVQLTEVSHAMGNHLKELENTDRLVKEFGETDKLRAAAISALENLKSKKAYSDRLVEEHSHLFTLYIAEQAGILAEELSDGKPCPVCGSTEHPNKARKSENAPDKRAVDNAKSAMDKARAYAEDAAKNYAAAKAACESAVSAVMKNAGKLAENCTVGEALENLRKKQAEIGAALAEENGRHEKLSLLAKKKSDAEQEAVSVENRITKNSEALSAAKGEQIGLAAKAEEKSKAAQKQLSELPCKSKAEAEKQIALLAAKKNALEKAINDAEQQLTELQKKHTELTGRLGELKEQTKGKEAPDCDALEAAKLESEKAVKEALEGRDEAKACFDATEEALGKLHSEMEKSRKLRQEYGMKSVLSGTANGTLAKKQRVSLETFVQMEYFDRILGHANVRLLQMTSGQYELVRSEATHGVAKVGLDIDVSDHFTGSVRSIKSLSGGESFMASLALALGFSDEIQQTSGGVRIDSMFVDEGFGTLDDESLNQAIMTLHGLAENSRLVGVISHVPELKEKLERQIIVTKDKTAGSSIRIVT